MQGRVRIVITPGDHACVDALRERAERREVGAGIGARRRQREVLDLVGDGALLSPKRVLKQMIGSHTSCK